MADFDSFDALEETPKDRALAVEINDLTLPWLADGLAIERAEREGHEIGDILSELEVLDNMGGEDEENVDTADVANQFADAYGAIARLLWLGFIRFEPNLSYDQVLGMVGPDTIDEIPLGTMTERLFPEDDEQEPDSEGK